MEQNKNKNEVKIELTPEVAAGHYANMAFISHSSNDLFLDFIVMTPNTPGPRVQSRIIMTPENAKNLLFALRDNLAKYEETFGEIVMKKPKSKEGNGFTA